MFYFDFVQKVQDVNIYEHLSDNWISTSKLYILH